MTGPSQEDSRDVPLGPARRDRLRAARRRASREPAELDDELADLERGRTAALLGALGRMQLRLDLIAREQRDELAAVKASLGAIEDRLAVADARAQRCDEQAASPLPFDVPQAPPPPRMLD